MDDAAIVIADAAGIIRFWSAGAEKTFGHASGHALGRSLDLIVPSEYSQAHWNGFRHAIATGVAGAEGKATPFPVRRADGEISTARGRLTLLRDPGGLAIGAAVVFETSHA